MSHELVFRDRAAIESAQAVAFAEMMDLVCERHPYYRDLLAARGDGERRDREPWSLGKATAEA
ncbi:MAG: hypothetical protein A3G81_16535 [Betaproteobacteria bacterium RIFCSPLOWO2_12_FULL_65_14]|nr:MAG: hypothetical protein A3G81_16535 [Betaproteobacteria bacterium RIFCSPLOWO2_12_FULL_65_14]